jgi:hypothetical protein
MYFAIRVGVASAILLACYVTRGFESRLETFVVAFGAALAGQAAALAIKLLVGDEPRSQRALVLLAATTLAAVASFAFAVVG